MVVEVETRLLGSEEKHWLIVGNGLYSEIQAQIHDILNIPQEDYYLTQNGKIASKTDIISGKVVITPRLHGGKGGFGSMLRAIGAQIEKTTNREACRDLSGRRLRDINEEQRLKKWISQQADREREAEERKQKRLAKLSAEPKHEFKDEQYEIERTGLIEKVSESLEQGMKASSSNTIKRKPEEVPQPQKKRKLLLDIDEDLSSDDSSDEERSEVNGSSVSSGAVKMATSVAV